MAASDNLGPQWWDIELGDPGEATAYGTSFDKDHTVSMGYTPPRAIPKIRTMNLSTGEVSEMGGSGVFPGNYQIDAVSTHWSDPLYGDAMPSTSSGRYLDFSAGNPMDPKDQERKSKRATRAFMAAQNRISKTGDPNVLPNGRRLTNPDRAQLHIWYDNKEEIE